MRFQFISVLAHEMKAPIAAIEGYLQMIHERSVGNKLEDYDHMVDRCLIRIEGMRKLITDLLDLTSIESGQRQRTLDFCRSVGSRPPGGRKRQGGDRATQYLDSAGCAGRTVHGGRPDGD